jgi:hypothetical protein
MNIFLVRMQSFSGRNMIGLSANSNNMSISEKYD